MQIRRFQSRDAEHLSALYYASVHQIGIRDYSSEQVQAWCPSRPDPENYRRRSEDGRTYLIAVDQQDFPIGYIDLESHGHIDHLYCHPSVIGKGIGSALYDALELVARSQNIPLLFVEASKAARRLFERKGFQVESRRDFTINGIAIHNYRMTKSLLKITCNP